MFKRIHAAMSPAALLIAILALVVSAAGAGYAAATIGTKDIKNNAITAKKIKKNAVTAKKIKAGAVNGAKVADGSLSGSDVANGTVTGDKIKSGAITSDKLAPGAGGAVAYARVRTDLTVTHAKGTWSVTRPATGRYCVKPPTFVDATTTPALVTIEWGNSSGSDLAAYWNGSPSCDPGEYEVRTYKLDPVAASDSVSFVITVP